MEHAVVSRDEWVAARKALLAREEALLQERNAIMEARRALPWTRIDKDYTFEGPDGPVTLADLFDGRSQLIVQHVMFGPDWDAGCPFCSYSLDHISAALVHIENHDVTFAAVSRAPYEKIRRYHARMGWPFQWVSSFGNDFNFDFKVSFTPEQIAAGAGGYNYSDDPVRMGELPGASVFAKNAAGEMFHTYSEFGQIGEDKQTASMLLDMTPMGRDVLNAAGQPVDWIRRHDEYAHQVKSSAPAVDAVPAVSGGCSCCH
jgi:predicted dithiol-disulfide oxidoreductase (DUF899 family)